MNRFEYDEAEGWLIENDGNGSSRIVAKEVSRLHGVAIATILNAAFSADEAVSKWLHSVSDVLIVPSTYVCPICKNTILREAHGGDHPSPGDHDPGPHVKKAYT